MSDRNVGEAWPGVAVTDGVRRGSIMLHHVALWWPFPHVRPGDDGLPEMVFDPEDWAPDDVRAEQWAEGWCREATEFVFYLLNLRCNWGRLVVALAAAERWQADTLDAVLSARVEETGSPLVDVTPGREGAVELPDWRDDPEQKARVAAALRACLDELEGAR